MRVPKACYCRHARRVTDQDGVTFIIPHLHTPGGVIDDSLRKFISGSGIQVLPFRPGSTARDRRKTEARSRGMARGATH